MVDWNALYAQQRTPWEDGIPWRPLAGMVGALVPAGGRVLDLGCGLGTQAMHLAATGYQVAGVDLAEEAITRARRAAASRGLEVDWRTGDFYRLDLGPPFALVFDRSVFANASDHGEREIEKIFSGAGLLQQRAKQDKQKNETDRYIYRDAENRLAGQPLIADQPLKRDALMGNQIRHRLAEDREYEKQGANHHQRNTNCAPCRLHQKNDPDTANNPFDRTRDTEPALLQQDADSRCNAFLGQPDVNRGARGNQRKHDINQGNAGTTAATTSRIDQKAEQHREGEMHTPRRDTDDDSEIRQEGQR